jgi:hypothetical protein
MGRIQYIVAEDHGQWFVEVQGQLYGPYESEERATRDAVRGAGSTRNSEVLVRGLPDKVAEGSGESDLNS